MKMKTRGSAVSRNRAGGKAGGGCREVSTQTMLNMSELDRIMLMFLCPRAEASTQTEDTCQETSPAFDTSVDHREDEINVLHDESCGASRHSSSDVGDESQEHGGGDTKNDVSVKEKEAHISTRAKMDLPNFEKKSARIEQCPILTPRTSKRLALKKDLKLSSTAKIKCNRKSSNVSKQKSPVHQTNKVDAVGVRMQNGMDGSKDDSCSAEGEVVSSIIKLEPELTLDGKMSPSMQNMAVPDTENKNCNACNNTDLDCAEKLSPAVASKVRKNTCKVCSRMFRDDNDFIQHNEMHAREKPYHCEECSSSFRWKASYLAHNRLVHKRQSQKLTPAKKSEKAEATPKKDTGDKSSKRNMKKLKERVPREKKTFECEFCRKSFRCVAHLTRHNLIHTGTRPFKCNQCPRAFSERSGLKNHVLRRHSDLKNHACDLCGKHFGSMVFLRQHKKVHTKQREEFVCKLCEKVYTTVIALEIHMLAHAGLKPFVCDVCGKRLYSKYQLNRHVKRHCIDQLPSNKKPTKPRSHVCNICSKAFRSASHLLRHMSTVHATTKDRYCPTCNKQFSSVGAIKKHMKEHNEGPYQCQVCDRWWLTKETFKSHMQLHFGRTSSKVYVCVHCNIGFFLMTELDDHYQSHVENTTFRCAHCEKIFELQEDLVTHRSVHPNQKVPLNCNRCDKLFATLQELRAHEHCHDYPLECIVCDLKFSTEEETKNHLQRHVDDGSVLSATVLMYKCPKCGKVFASRSDYDRHALVHDGAEFVCNLCDFAFENAPALQEHLNTHSVIKIEVSSSGGELAGNFEAPFPDSGPQMPMCGQIPLQTPINPESAETIDTVIQYEAANESELAVCQTLHINDGEECISCTVCGKKFFLIEHFLTHCQGHPEIEVTVKTI